MADRGTVCEPGVSAREPRRSAPSNSDQSSMRGGHVPARPPTIAGVDLALKPRRSTSFPARALRRSSDVKSREENFAISADQIEGRADGRDGWGEADLQVARPPCVGTLGPLRRTASAEASVRLQHWKDFLSKVGELRQLAFAVDQLAAEFLLELLHPLGQGGLRDIATARLRG